MQLPFCCYSTGRAEASSALDTRTPAGGHHIHCSTRQGCLLLACGSTPSITVLRSRWGSAVSPVTTAPPGGCATAWPSLLGSSIPDAVSTYQTNASRHGGKHAFFSFEAVSLRPQDFKNFKKHLFQFLFTPFPHCHLFTGLKQAGIGAGDASVGQRSHDPQNCPPLKGWRCSYWVKVIMPGLFLP